jgi:hypothetical protein
MPFEDNSPQEQTPSVIASRFLIGVALGLVLLLVYLVSAMLLSLSSIEWNVTKISIFASVPIVCGLLSAVFGKRFLDMLIAIIGNLPG